MWMVCKLATNLHQKTIQLSNSYENHWVHLHFSKSSPEFGDFAWNETIRVPQMRLDQGIMNGLHCQGEGLAQKEQDAWNNLSLIGTLHREVLPHFLAMKKVEAKIKVAYVMVRM